MALRAWSEIASGEAGRAMGGSLLLPLFIGLTLGVPLVGREIEQRTAATAWALAGSRRRWLLGRMWPVLALAVVLGIAIATTSDVLSVTRRLGDSTYDDAIFVGLPVVGHIILALGIGVSVGAVVGRTLPAFLVAMVGVFLALSLALAFHSASRPPYPMDSQPDSSRFIDLLDPRWDYDFIAPDGRVLSREEALATVPVGTTDISTWLADAYEIDSLGVADSVTRSVQFQEAAASVVVGALLLALAFPIVERRRPG
jgi:hypothetical protein